MPEEKNCMHVYAGVVCTGFKYITAFFQITVLSLCQELTLNEDFANLSCLLCW